MIIELESMKIYIGSNFCIKTLQNTTAMIDAKIMCSKHNQQVIQFVHLMDMKII